MQFFIMFTESVHSYSVFLLKFHALFSCVYSAPFTPGGLLTDTAEMTPPEVPCILVSSILPLTSNTEFPQLYIV
jgi:hypothetical protein